MTLVLRDFYNAFNERIHKFKGGIYHETIFQRLWRIM